MKETVVEWRVVASSPALQYEIKPPFTWRYWMGGTHPNTARLVLRSGDEHHEWALLDLITDLNMPEEERDRIKQSLVDLCNIRWGGAS